LEIDCHLVREKLQADIMKLLSVSSQDQLVDFFTKSLLPQPFNVLLSKLGLLDLYQPLTCGGYYMTLQMEMTWAPSNSVLV